MQTVQLYSLQELLVENLPDEVSRVPSMMSKEEKSFLYGMAKDYYIGEGEIVDAGVFLGGSTVCFGVGLRNNSNQIDSPNKDTRRIKTYEKASTNPNMVHFFKRHDIDTDILKGESFEPLLRSYIKPIEDLVELTIGDITLASWLQNQKIEILFLDVIKDPKINSHILKTFMPHLIPGRSIVVQQDYFIDRLPYLKVTQEALDPYFDYIGEIRSTALFRLNQPIPQELLENDPSQNLPKEKQLELIEKSVKRTIDPNRQFLMNLSKIRLIGQYFGKQEGLEAIHELEQNCPDLVSNKVMPRLKLAYQDIIDYLNNLRN